MTIHKGDTELAYEISPMYRESHLGEVEGVIAAELKAAQGRVKEADESLNAAWQEHRHAVEQWWQAYIQAAYMRPLLAAVAEYRQVLDPLVKQLGGEPENTGSGHLCLTLAQLLRRPTRPQEG